MRQIKFRAWHTKHERLADVAAIDFNDFGGTGTITTEYGDEWGMEWCVLEQFTGLTDKNGKEIYEGDIVKSDALDYPTEVRWLWSRYGLVNEKKNPQPQFYFNMHTLKVIGNIHED